MSEQTDRDRMQWYADEFYRIAELICTVPPHIQWENKKNVGEVIALVTTAMMRAGRLHLPNRSDHEGV